MGKRILVIEPSRTLQSILSMYFQREGHQVVLFDNYHKQQIRHFRISIVNHPT